MVIIDCLSDFSSPDQLNQLVLIQAVISRPFRNSTVNVVRLPGFTIHFLMVSLLAIHVLEVDFHFHFLLIHSTIMQLIGFIEPKRFDFIEELLRFL